MGDTVSKYINGMDTDEMKKNTKTAVMNMGHSLEEISNRMAETSTDLSKKTMSTIKKYPLHTALAAGAVGFLVGAIIARK